MKTRILSLALGYIVFFSCTSISQKQDVSSFIEKYHLSKINPLFILAIESSECQKCKVAIDLIIQWAKENNKTDELLFLVRGIRKAEISYYAQNQLNISADSFRFIADEGDFAKLNKNLVSSLIIVNDEKVENILSIYEGVNYLMDNYSKNEYELALKDSVILDESAMPISRKCQIALLNDSQLLLLDPEYANLSVYNIKSGKQEKRCSFNYDYESLYRYYIAHDTAALKDIKATREAIGKETSIKELALKYLYVKRDKIYITAQITFPSSSNLSESKEDITVGFHDFLIIMDSSFNKQEYIYLTEAFGREYFFVNYLPFILMNGTTNQFLFQIQKLFIDPQTGMPSRKKEYKNLPFLASLTLDTITKKFSPLKVSERTLPAYFEETHLGYGLNDVKFCRKDNGQYYYFKGLPFLYNLNSSEILSIPDTSYKYLKIDASKPNWLTETKWSDKFDFSEMSFTKNNDIAYLAYFKKQMYFVVCNPITQQIKHKTQLPFISYKNLAHRGCIITDKELYVISSMQEHTMLYKFQYVN